MISSDELLATAHQLLTPSGLAGITQSAVRRSISTAYYALYHHVLSAAADRFVGSEFRGKSSAYSSVYRSIAHSRVADTCRKLDQKTLSPTLQTQLGRASVSQPLRDFAASFLRLWELREFADYEPAADFTVADAQLAAAEARWAITQWDGATQGERTDILALMLANPRR